LTDKLLDDAKLARSMIGACPKDSPPDD